MSDDLARGQQCPDDGKVSGLSFSQPNLDIYPTAAMATLLFPLRGVPDDEAEAVRRLLTENQIDFYETSAGNWGISTPAIWVQGDQDLEKARSLIADYEKLRFAEERAKYLDLRRSGRHRKLVDVIREDPWRVILYLAFVAFLLYVSIWPFFDFGQ